MQTFNKSLLMICRDNGT